MTAPLRLGALAGRLAFAPIGPVFFHAFGNFVAFGGAHRFSSAAVVCLRRFGRGELFQGGNRAPHPLSLHVQLVENISQIHARSSRLVPWFTFITNELGSRETILRVLK